MPHFYEYVGWVVDSWSLVRRTSKGTVDPVAESVVTDSALRTLPPIDLWYSSANSYTGIHRSGWAYALSGLNALQAYGDNALIVDTYCDSTFLWAKQLKVDAGIVPYKKAWIGFFHHPFSETYSPHNLTRVFQTPEFLESLKTCKCLIVLVNTLAVQLRRALEEHGFGRVPVKVLTHPTETPTQTAMFTPLRFFNNPTRALLQVGAWL
ncbi:hypothetical protein M427DRAFT_28454 [Gonapodya prolifera JEL478]|uniref:Glycosyltransferase family 1 protein n=1 Tax=Gonapodya prolifera (strain JEL478) TaxID=1344416 RepID=A0A139ATU2_GONPJ|nr:hypothetical protein M427DRAFT_28454 [Gonapodya prolifera JEL478]|eukprot:KXS20152.1 hypothetical protein M427DRAFT_28454 [Gonapodya prolifera JEL478]